MNMVIPMAGVGSRFSKTHSGELKPLIDVKGKPMVTRIIDNLSQDKQTKFFLIISSQLSTDKSFKDILDSLDINYELIVAEALTEGPACTCLLAEKYINNSQQLIIVNCDQIIVDFNIKNLLNFAKFNQADGIVGAFHSNSNKNSYIKLSEDLRIQEIKEKIVISNIATNGLHFWSKGSDFVYSANEMIKKDERYGNEFYVAPSYNYMIRDGKKIIPYYYNLHYPIGVPDDLNYFTEQIYENL